MKKVLLIVSSLALSAALNVSAFAAEHPCKAVFEACKSAGFTSKASAKDGKATKKDCIKPLLKGQTVAGVTVDASVLEQCKAHKAAKKAAKHAKKEAAAAQ